MTTTTATTTTTTTTATATATTTTTTTTTTTPGGNQNVPSLRKRIQYKTSTNRSNRMNESERRRKAPTINRGCTAECCVYNQSNDRSQPDWKKTRR
jgi:hypothetical protein